MKTYGQRTTAPPILDALEPRQLLSLSIVSNTGGALFGGRDGVYSSNWVTDGSLAGQFGSFDGESHEFDVWNGQVVRDHNAISAGREAGLSGLGLSLDIRSSFLVDRSSLTIGDVTYYNEDHALSRTTGHVAISERLGSYSTEVRIGQLARLGASKSFCFLADFDDKRYLFRSDGGAAKGVAEIGRDAGTMNMMAAGKLVFFAGGGTADGAELWRTDGTAAGTFRVADLLPGSRSSGPVFCAALGNKLIFAAHDRHGECMWVSDGTAAGTTILARLPYLSAQDPRTAITIGGKHYFLSQSSTRGMEMFVTDGTVAGTHIVVDANPRGESSFPNSITALNGRVYFNAMTSENTYEIFRSDGTEAGTARITDLALSTQAPYSVSSLTAFNGMLYFTAAGKIMRISDSKISIGGIAFNDTDADAARDPEDKLLRNVRIFNDANDNKTFDDGEASTFTDSRGRYEFADLSPGTYHIRQVAPGGTRETSPSYVMSLVAGDHVIKDFGSTRSGAILTGRVAEKDAGLGGFTVFLDRDGNGKRSKGDPVAITDDGGRYAFAGLTAGLYTVGVEKAENWIVTGARAARARVTNRVTTVPTFDRLAGSIVGFFLFDDRNGDGHKQPDEDLIRGNDAAVTLQTTSSAGKPIEIDSEIDDEGHRLFTDLLQNSYTIHVTGGGWSLTQRYGPIKLDYATVKIYSLGIKKA